MTPEKEIVEAAVAWRRAWYEVYEATEARVQSKDTHKEYNEAATLATRKLDAAELLKNKLTDLLDQYIQEDKD